MSDHIRIKRLRVSTRLGVTEEERSLPQTVAISVSITPAKSFKGFEDRIEKTIDYDAVCRSLRQVAAKGERNLVETLAEELAEAVIEFEGVCAVTLEIEKFIIPDCESVGVVITRAREHH